MASEYTIQQILTFQQISQYLSGNDNSKMNQLMSGSIVGDLPGLLNMEGYLLLNMNSLNPSSSTLRATAEYVLSLCGKYAVQAKNIVANLAQSPPIITGPASQSGLVGFTAVFSVSVVSSLPVTYSWFRNGIVIPGATNSSYTLTNAQLTDSGSTFYVRATNAAGNTVSGTAVLTVTQSIVGFAYAGGTDYSAALQGGTDAVPFQFTFPITTGQPLSVQFPGPVVDEFIVIKYPSTEPTKIAYNNPPIDAAAIPGFAFNATAITTWKYIFSRSGNAFTVNNSNLITFS